MAIAPFDASKAVTFDLARGHLQTPDTNRGLLVPSAAIAELCRGADDDVVLALGNRLGESVGRAVEAELRRGGTSVRGAGLEEMVDHLDGHWALMGLGRLGIERWGRALVAVIDDSPLDDAGDPLIAQVLAAALAPATSARLACVRLHRDGARARFFVTTKAGADRIREWLGAGVPWAEALVRLHGRTQSGSRGDA